MASRLCYLRWRDACYVEEDSHHRELGEPVELEELGWLIKETKECVVIGIENMPYSRHSRLTLTIPKVNIVERKVINRKQFLEWLRK